MAHLDMKPENFVFRHGGARSVAGQTGDPDDDSATLVLVDFGSAEHFKKATYAETSSDYVSGMDDEVEIDRLIGTAAYLSPEVAEGRFRYLKNSLLN